MLTVRLNEDDMETLKERCVEVGMSQSEYIRFLIRKARIKLEVVT